MINSLRQRAWTSIRAKFPERQVYIRSGARVRFFTVSPLMQTVIVGVATLCLGWVVFTTAHTVFKDQILALREAHFRRVQLSYEARVARLQLGFDRVNDELKGAQSHFNAIAADLEAKHRVLAGLIRRKEALRTSLDGHDSAGSDADNPPPRAKAAQTPAGGGIGGGNDPASPPAASPASPHAFAPADWDSPIPSGDIEPPRGRTSALIGSAMEGFASVFRRALRMEDVEEAPLRRIAEIENRLTGLYPAQETLLHAAEADVDADENRFIRAIRATGIDPSGLLAKVGGAGADASADRGTEPPEFDARAARTSRSIDRLAKIVTVLRSVPVATPVHGSEFEQTSGFGGRTDPFSHREAFHAGLDFAGPWGADVHVTAPGIVTYAGARGGYGNTIEVDHGYGIRTRYGHLSRILVRVGNTLEKGAVVGKLGSTGRSTGPHVHYEIWYDDAVRNPSRFLRAASYVHEN